MIPFGDLTVTLVQRIEVITNGKTQIKYARHILSGCSWKMQDRWQLVGTEMQRSIDITCRIPHGSVMPTVGDYLFRGYLREPITDTKSVNEAIAKYRASGAMRVASVSNNAIAGMPMPHIAARGNSV